jgi:hypothetical protein
MPPPSKKDTFIITYTGKQFYPFNPNSNDVDIIDIAVALSRKGRWNDHCKFQYTVGAHSIQVAQRVQDAGGSEEEILGGLLHDAGEAYFADVPTPIKRHLADIAELELGIQGAIEQRFSLPDGILDCPIVKQADRAALLFEAKTLLHRVPEWVGDHPELDEALCRVERLGFETMDSPIYAQRLDNDKIMKLFLDRFFELGGGSR